MDWFGYKGNVCVVTGAASGMGKATAEMLVGLGADVYALDRNVIDIAGVNQMIQMDLGSRDSIDEVFSRLPGKIDKFFGIAGISGARNSFEEVVTVNFISNKYITEEYLLDRLPDGPVGAIAFMSSQGGAQWRKWLNEFKDVAEAASWDDALAALGSRGSGTGLGGYELSKRAMTYYTKLMATKLGPRNIRVNCVCPGNTVSGLIDDFRGFAGSFEKSKEMWGPIQREGTSQEMANAIVFANSALAEMVSGADIAVDGASRAAIDIGLRDGSIMDQSSYSRPNCNR